MRTQPDVAEQILQKNGGPMHYKSIVDEAVKLGLINRTANNSETLYGNVRKAVASDVRFVKIKKGLFDLASRQENVRQQINQHEENTDMPTPEEKDTIPIPEFQVISQDLKNKCVIEIEMKRLRDACGWGSIKKNVVEEIQAKLCSHGLGHVPINLPMNQNAIVLVYELSSLVGTIVEAVRAEAETSDSNKKIVDRIRDIVSE